MGSVVFAGRDESSEGAEARHQIGDGQGKRRDPAGAGSELTDLQVWRGMALGLLLSAVVWLVILLAWLI